MCTYGSIHVSWNSGQSIIGLDIIILLIGRSKSLVTTLL